MHRGKFAQLNQSDIMVDSFAPNVFDTNAKLMQIRRAASADCISTGQDAVETADDHHFLHAEAAERLSDRLLDLEDTFETVAVLGWWPTDICELVPEKLSKAHVVDLSFNRPQAQTELEFLPLRANSFDLIISNMALHWINDLPGMLAQIRAALKPNGVFLGSALGGETLHELRASFVEAETQISGGYHPRVSPVMDLRDAAGLLQRAGVNLPVADIDRISVAYDNPMKLLQDLRGMGQTNAVIGRQTTLTSRRVLFGALQHYIENFADDDGAVPATFDCLFLSGWSPHKSQQKPLRPGQATNSLAQALGATEHPLKS